MFLIIAITFLVNRTSFAHNIQWLTVGVNPQVPVAISCAGSVKFPPTLPPPFHGSTTTGWGDYIEPLCWRAELGGLEGIGHYNSDP